jgi:hypothetical protein
MKKDYDPLAVIPSPDAIRNRLAATLTLAERLKILLETSERIMRATAHESDCALTHLPSIPAK